MSVENKVKKVEEAVVAEAEKVETAVVEEVKKAEAVVKRVRVEITDAEKVALRDAETEFLRAQVNIRDLQTQIKDFVSKSEAATKKYSEKLEELVKTYGINKAEMAFDNLENVFKAVGNKL